MWDLCGHNGVFSSLKRDIDTNNLAHANLFTGPPHIGKSSAAMWLAKFLQCANGGCGNCHVCTEIDRGLHADTVIVPDDGEKIKIEQIRALIDKVNMTRREKYKILLIENIERMTVESANALLKTLEDPPEGVLFLLTTSRVREIMPTIISRVRVYQFGNLKEAEMMNLMKEKYPLAETDTVEMAVELAGGKPGKALQLMENEDLFESYRKMYGDVEKLIAEPDRVSQSAYANELVTLQKDTKDKNVISDFLDVLQLILRKNMVMNINGENGILPQEKVLMLLENIDSIREYSKRNVNTRMMLENLMFTL